MRSFQVVFLSFLMNGPANAHDRSWPGQKLAEVLPEAVSFTSRPASLTPAQVQWVESALGEPIRAEDRSPNFYVGTDKAAKPVGVVVFLDADGANGKIEMGESLDPAGKILHVVVFDNGESPAVSKPEFLGQFAGKTANDPFRVGSDVTAPATGAASAQVIATAARRGTLLAAAALRLGATGGSQ